MRRRALFALGVAVAAATSGVLVVPRLLDDDARPLESVRWSDYKVSADGKTLAVRFFHPGCSDDFERLEVVETNRAVRITCLWRSPAPGTFCKTGCPFGVHPATVTLAEPLGNRVVQPFPDSAPHCSDGLVGAANLEELSSLGSWP